MTLVEPWHNYGFDCRSSGTFIPSQFYLELPCYSRQRAVGMEKEPGWQSCGRVARDSRAEWAVSPDEVDRAANPLSHPCTSSIS